MKIFKLALLVALIILVKHGVFKPTMITSNSMSNTLEKGDYTILNQWQKPFLGNNIQIKNNQVLAFHYPLDKGPVEEKMVYIKRCVGLPGDSLIINEGKIEGNTLLNLKFDYIVDDPEHQINQEFLKKYNLNIEEKRLNNLCLLSMDEQQIKTLLEVFPSMEPKIISQHQNEFDPTIFPSDTSIKWNRDFYGPIYVPKSGDQINLNMKNISLYKKIIETYENHKLEVLDDSVLIDGASVETFTFRENYYFFMGDNRHQSIDSRHWGFVPEDHLIGTCTRVLFNIENPSAKRIFKSIR